MREKLLSCIYGMKPMGRTSRLDITLNDKLTELFDDLAKEDNISRTEVLKRAMATYRILKEQQKQKKKIVFRSDDGSADRELLLL